MDSNYLSVGSHRFDCFPPALAVTGGDLEMLPEGMGSIPAVSDVVQQRPPTSRVLDLTPREQVKLAKQSHREWKAEYKSAKKRALSGPTPTESRDVVERMEAVTKFITVQQSYLTSRENLKLAKHAALGPVGKAGHRVNRHVTRFFTWFAHTITMGRASGMEDNVPLAAYILAVDVSDLVRRSRDAHQKTVDKQACRRLIAAGEQQLQRTDLSPTDREIIQKGVDALQQRIDAQSSEENIQRAVLSGIAVIHSMAALLNSIGHGLTDSTHLISSVPVVLGSIGMVTMPIGAALSLDSLWAAFRNANRAKRDRTVVLGWQQTISDSRRNIVQFPDVVRELRDQRPPADATLLSNLVELEKRVEVAQVVLTGIERQLLAGNNSKEEVARLKAGRREAQEFTDNALKIATHLLENQPGLERCHSQLVAKQALSNSLSVMQQTVNPFIEQKLKTKIVGEYVRSVAEFLALGATVTTAVGLATAPAMGAGSPIILAGGILGILSATTVYGGGALVTLIRRMQLGTDRITGTEFKEAFLETIQREVAQWPAIEAAGLQKATMASFMFELARRHDPTIGPNWDAKRWAEAIANDGPDGVHRKALDAAMERMLYHDFTQGFIGIAVGKVIRAVGKFRKERPDTGATAKAAA